MPKISIPKDELDKNVPLMPVGWYPCIISNVELTKTKEEKKDMYVFHFTILEGEYTGKKFMRWCPEPFGSMGPVLEGLKAPKDPNGGYDIDPMDCRGRKLDVHNSRGKNSKNGKDTNEPDDFRPIANASPTPAVAQA